MEFKCLTNIETSFRQLRMYALVFAGVCAVVTVAAVWMSCWERRFVSILFHFLSLLGACPFSEGPIRAGRAPCAAHSGPARCFVGPRFPRRSPYGARALRRGGLGPPGFGGRVSPNGFRPAGRNPL